MKSDTKQTLTQALVGKVRERLRVWISGSAEQNMPVNAVVSETSSAEGFEETRATVSKVNKRFNIWLRDLNDARASGIEAEVRARIASELEQFSLPRLAATAPRFGAQYGTGKAEVVKDYIWLKYGSVSLPGTPEEFDAMTEACARFTPVPPKFVAFLRDGKGRNHKIDEDWLQSHRSAEAREQILSEIKLSGNSVAPFLHPATADLFRAALGETGPVLMLTSHLGYRRMRAIMGKAFARNVSAAGGKKDMSASVARAVAFRSIRCLQQGGVLFVAPDGPNGELRRQIDLDGLIVDISTGPIRLGFETNARVVFFCVHYGNGMFVPHFVAGPSREKTDTRRGYIDKVSTFYETCLREILWGDPNQLLIPFARYKIFETQLDLPRR